VDREGRVGDKGKDNRVEDKGHNDDDDDKNLFCGKIFFYDRTSSSIYNRKIIYGFLSIIKTIIFMDII
jgi:hypothetical protein